MRDLVRFRHAIWRHALADLRHRYAGTRGGVVWNVIQPLALIATYSLVFTTIFARHSPDVRGNFGYVLYLCSGFFPFLAFSECVLRGCGAFLESAGYLRKLPVPEQIFVARVAVSATVTLFVSFALLMALAVAVGVRPTWHWLLLPLPLLVFVAMGFAFGLLFATLNVFFRDLAQVLEIAMQVVMWTAPIIYVPQILPAFLKQLLPFHPLVPPLLAVRELFLDARLPPPQVWPAMLAWPAGALVLAYFVLGKLRHEIRDVI